MTDESETTQPPPAVQVLVRTTSSTRFDLVQEHRLVTKLLEQLECPVCYEVNEPPIFMCRNGHNVCYLCRERVKECATCRLPGRPEIRNRFAEETYDRLTVPCANTSRGCAKRTLPWHAFAHGLECSHAPAKCQLCAFVGGQQELVAHLQEEHTQVESVILDKPMHRKVKLEGADFTHTAFIQFGDQLFWLAEKYDAASHTFATQVFKNGPDDVRRSDYVCTVRIASKDDADRLTFRYAIPFASSFVAANDRVVAGRGLAALAGDDDVVRYRIGIEPPKNEMELIADQIKMVVSNGHAQDEEVDLFYIIFMPLLFIFVVGLFKGWWNFAFGGVA